MSKSEGSGITRNVIVRTGKDNYHAWFTTIHSYLQTLCLWRICNGDKIQPVIAAGPPAVTVVDIEKWIEDAMQANGVIALYIKDELRTHLVDTYPAPPAAQESMALCTLATLKAQYETTGPTGQFHLFRQTIRWQLDSNEDASAQIGQIQDLFEKLSAAGLTIPQNLRAMLICAGCPPSSDGVITTAIHTKDAADFTPANIIPMILNEAERHKDGALVNRIEGVSRGRKTFKQKPKTQKGKTRCAKCRGTGHTIEEHQDDYVKPGAIGGQKQKNPTSAVPAKNTNKGKGKAKGNQVETHVAFMAVDSSTTLIESNCFMEIDDPVE
jgi:hypothetical protein